MKNISKIVSVFVLCPLLVASAQTGRYGSHTQPKTAKSGGVHTDTETQNTGDPAVQPIAGASIYLFEVGTHGPNTTPYSLFDCSLVGDGTVQGPDDNGNCYVVSGSDGTFHIDNSLTNYYNQCDSDSSLVYMLAVGGQRAYVPSDPLNPDPTLENALIANIAVSPVDCATLTTESNFYVSDLTTVAAAYTLGTFANQTTTPVDGFSTKSTTASMGALQTAFQAANNLVPTLSGLGSAFGSGVNTTAQETMSAVADIMTACMVTGGSTSSGTPCGQLFGYATNTNYLTGGTLTPTDLWLTPLYMVENPYSNGNISNEGNLIASYSNPVWSPLYASDASLPTSWDIETTASTSLGGPVISNLIPPGAGQIGYYSYPENSTLYINGSNLVGTCGISPIVVVDGIAATVTSSSQTAMTVTVPNTYSLNAQHKFSGYVQVYSCGYASNDIQLIVTQH